MATNNVDGDGNNQPASQPATNFSFSFLHAFWQSSSTCAVCVIAFKVSGIRQSSIMLMNVDDG